MTEVSRRVRWLTDTEMLAWRSYIVSTLKLRQRLHRELTDQHDVSLTDYEVLVCLSMAEDGSMRMTELAQLLGSTKSRLSHQVARMEEAGYLRRGKDPRDRRGVTAELTQEGEGLLERSAPTHVEGVREHFVDLLTTEEQLLLGEVFSRVLAHLTELED
ncbi:DNA-binding MarR family transcriptional regulator [Saccharomonospora amisosensis]|uniref:DNA-binding MarR family transcriptional regulator n=1 Tax=Saccharomonospora amisosensis TaxID=1128677 RepID=A0A7X5ZTG9_9PSEU|nr:MarR family transcriptional regulator [Saccharomonospora amisosensis]NIJ14606.1 DNA-binding MarR family transcriptional regulator [Saccharomonospora amisosensis]